MKMRKGKKGFTIVELIVVMTIIMILAGLIAAAALPAKKKAMIAKARATIASIETALSMYQTDVGSYPATGNATMVTQLTAPVPPPTGWSGPYIQSTEIVGGTIRDPWNTAYTYTKPGTNHGVGVDYQNYVDIYSWGPNCTDEQGDNTPPKDDISNWRRN